MKESRWLELLLCLALGGAVMGGCRKEMKYPIGRDTYKAFGNGRFQLCTGGCGCLNLGGYEAQDGSLINVTNWKRRGDYVYAVNALGLYGILDLQAATLSTFRGLERVPKAHQPFCRQLRNNVREVQTWAGGRYALVECPRFGLLGRFGAGTRLDLVDTRENRILNLDVHQWMKDGDMILFTAGGYDSFGVLDLSANNYQGYGDELDMKRNTGKRVQIKFRSLMEK